MRPLLFLLLILLPLLLLVFSCSDPRVSDPPRPRVESEQAPPVRIVSLAPSITEILFDLGLGNRIAGVTRYCDYPPQAKEKPRIGGYFDVNYEALLALEPDLVIHLVEHSDAQERLKDLGIETLAVDHSSVDGILESITVIAQRCGVKEEGRKLRGGLDRRIREIRKDHFPSSSGHRVSASGSLPPRVLVAVGRSLQAGEAGEIYISGRDGFYNDLINLAGGTNAYREETLKFPALSAEGLVQLDPDVIIEMVPDVSRGNDLTSLMSYWENIPGLRAAREGQVYILGGDYVVVPGPRFIDLLEKMGEIISRVENCGLRVEN